MMPRVFSRLRWVGFGALLGLAACGPVESTEEPLGTVRQPIAAPLPQAYCTIQVDGVGDVDTEKDYLPHLVQCENGGANLQALKAQAIAGRSVAYYAMADSGSICNSQSCQVYSCGKTPEPIHYQAVNETAGMYLSYDDMLTYAFYVAGDSSVTPPSCVGSSGTTEHWVTYNEGKTGADVEQTELGYVSYPIFGQNRGCMSQWGARCLENNKSYDYLGILRFFYGADIEVLTAPGSCVVPVKPELDASLIGSGSDAEANGSGGYRVCAGTAFHFWFELENTGSAPWTDVSGTSVGTAVRLGVPGDGTDPLSGASRVSLTENANDDVRSSGGDCNDAPGCRRTRFVEGAGIAAVAPSQAGPVTTTWQLVDEGRAWFGPQVSLAFEVVDCAGGSGGSGGGEVGGGAGASGGPGGSGGSAGSAGGAGGSAGSGSAAYAYAAEEPDGCACGVAGGRQTGLPWVGLWLGWVVWGGRRRGRRAGLPR